MKGRMRVLAFFVAVVLGALAVVTTTAGAYTLAVRPAAEVTLASLGSLTFEGSGIAVECNWTLAGSLSAGPTTLAAGVELGEVAEASWSECEGGAVAGVLGLPWPIDYAGVTGTLPNALTGLALQVEGFGVRFSVFGELVNCLYAGNLNLSLALSGGNPYRSGLAAVEGELERTGGTFCPLEVSVAGTLALEPPQTLTVGGITIEPAGSMTLGGPLTFAGGGAEVECIWGLGGALVTGPVGIVAGTSVGTIREAAAAGCMGGGAVTVLALPWTVRYLGVQGVIPAAVSEVDLAIEGVAVRFGIFGGIIGCLYSGEFVGHLEVAGENPYTTGLFELGETTLELVAGSGLCPEAVTVAGALELEPEQVITFI